MKRIFNENDIRKMVAKSLRESIGENFTGEYRTKGSLNKSTLAKNAGKSAEEILADRKKKSEEDELASRWAETADDIMKRWGGDEEEYDDTTAGGSYKIDKYNPYFFDKDGEKTPADAIGNFHNDFAIVKKDGKVNYINSDGKVLCDEWFDACNDFEDGLGLVSKDRKRNFVNDRGSYILDVWVDRAGDFICGRAPIIINGERHEINRDGKIV